MYYMLTFPALPQPRCPRYFIELQLHRRISPQACFPHRNKTVTQMFLFSSPKGPLNILLPLPLLAFQKGEKVHWDADVVLRRFRLEPGPRLDRSESKFLQLRGRPLVAPQVLFEWRKFEFRIYLFFHGGLLWIWPNYPYRFFLYFVLYLVLS